MHLKKLALVAMGFLAATTALACSSQGVEEQEGDEGALSEKNLGGRDFGLKDGELILTLDDGPGVRTKELVDFLVKEKVPATFFMVGKNARANQTAVDYVASQSSAVPGGLIVANHSMTHTDPLPKQGVAGSINEVMSADAILKGAITTSQTQFLPAQPMSFFRPPYGAFTALGAANIAKVNAGGGSAYVGPVFWEIGGELKNGYAADWACWGKNGVSPDECARKYVAEAKFRKKGIVLCHDVHAKTIDMLTGKPGSTASFSLVLALKDPAYAQQHGVDTSGYPRDPAGKVIGYKFVSMRRDQDQHSNAFAQQTQANQASAAQIVAQSAVEQNSQTQVSGVVVTYDVSRVPGAEKATVTFDRGPQAGDTPTAKSGVVSDKGKLGPGQHFVVVAAIDASNNVIVENRFNVIVPQEVDAEDDGDDACTNYHKLKVVRSDGRTAGRPFKLLHGRKAGCSGDGVECFKYNGTAKVAAGADGRSAKVAAVGGDEWSVEYDLTYASAPADKSKLSLVLETVTGNIVTGKRVKLSGAEMATLHETAVDCANGVWKGQFVYPSGATEEFLFRVPASGEPEYNDR